jgi:Mn2+/Fe2+ NRAMP family transporter
MARKDPDAVRITSAHRGHSEDLAKRQRRYVVSMGIRTVCFVLAVVFAGTVLMWVFIIASFVLPYVAVVMANAGASTDPDGPPPFAIDPPR